MIKVLIVEDSIVARELLNHILSSDPEITVVGTAANGEEGIEMVKRKSPDVVTMDIIMPKMDGYEATRRIMQTNPVPIVIVTSSLVREEVEKTWRAIDAGAVAVLNKPSLFEREAHVGEREKLIQTVKIMSQVKVVRRWNLSPSPTQAPRPVSKPEVVARPTSVKVVAVGASTGGPPVLQKIFSTMPADLAAPILVVQHIAAGFTVGFVDWLNRSSTLKVHLASNGQQALPGNVYVAPDAHQMKLDGNGRIGVVPDAPENGLRPAVSYLFRSVAQTIGDKAIGVLLTGMGRDGAQELKLMRDKGAVTIAQDEETSIVYGMPGEAAKIGAAKYSLPPEKIAATIRMLVQK
ncbi:MAG: chemotaxis response regulator protein-glutamate methylesterase [Desulfomonile tiedjei]|nr:chemotaxis response regulator protein-glutamate methylesterase [Desulfomonile tiedjei]